MNQVVDRLAHKQARREPRPEQLVAVGRRAVGRRHAAGHVEVVEPCGGMADRVEPGVDLEHLPRVGSGVIRIAREVVIGEHVMPRPVRVVVAEPAAEIVAVAAVLGLSALGLELARVRPESESRGR